MESSSMKYAKPDGFYGRGTGNKNWRKYKWLVYLHGVEAGKFVSIEDINKQLKLDLSCDKVWRLCTGKRVDHSATNKPKSFVSRYGHIKIEKIDEFVDDVCSYDTRKIYAERCART